MKFWRRPHSRTNRYGTTYDVKGHSVHRRHTSGGAASFGLAFFKGKVFINDSQTYKTNCPSCGGSVFFYQNEFGSRVFFDDLGPPWPKHEDSCPNWQPKWQNAKLPTRPKAATKSDVAGMQVIDPLLLDAMRKGFNQRKR